MADGRRFLIWGSSGHGKVLADVIASRGGCVELLVDNDPKAVACVEGARLLHGEEQLRAWIESAPARMPDSAAVAIGGSRGSDRRRLLAVLRGLGFEPAPIVHPRAAVSAASSVGKGCHVLANAVVAAGARLGDAVIVNNGAVVDHESVLEDGVHVCPGATLCGLVHVEQDAMIGAGATVLPRLRIGRGSIVGAAANVTRDVPPGVVVVGNPARILGSAQ